MIAYSIRHNSNSAAFYQPKFFGVNPSDQAVTLISTLTVDESKPQTLGSKLLILMNIGTECYQRAHFTT